MKFKNEVGAKALKGFSWSRRIYCPFIAILVTSCVAIFPALASNDTFELCTRAAQDAAVQTGVPLSVLNAISLSETGRTRGGEFRPWPWTVNMEGKGVWFDTEQAAREYVYKNHKRGARSFDVGCFQLNYKWHGKAFSSIEQMFDPSENAAYAARFLKQLHAELGNWPDAAGAYHSRTPKYASKYKKRFNSIHAKLATQSDSVPLLAQATLGGQDIKTTQRRQNDQTNGFPLLFRTSLQPSVLGSLVPIDAGAGLPRLIGQGN